MIGIKFYSNSINHHKLTQPPQYFTTCMMTEYSIATEIDFVADERPELRQHGVKGFWCGLVYVGNTTVTAWLHPTSWDQLELEQCNLCCDCESDKCQQ